MKHNKTHSPHISTQLKKKKKISKNSFFVLSSPKPFSGSYLSTAATTILNFGSLSSFCIYTEIYHK